MRIKLLEGDGFNTGKFKGYLRNQYIDIKKGRYLKDDISHPLYSEKEFYFKRIYCLEFENKKVYFLNTFGKTDSQKGFHIALSEWQNQRFLWLQNRHWIQKEENIRYIVNLLFLVLGAYIAIKNIK
ncbi:hypothetical protein [Flavobacterium sp. W20_MBD1_R3]|uniref:hypothetical protein n=1 Tax=Flavobacterium sp. W20_MBD1_R3 TaxID=3240278 RepID=UPI003F937144